MELDLVDATSAAIERAQLWRKSVRLARPFRYFSRADTGAQCLEIVARPGSAIASDGLLQRRVSGEQIAIDERRRLIQHFMRCTHPVLLLHRARRVEIEFD